MERTVRGSILQSERNDHFRASSNTLQEPITRSLYLPWFLESTLYRVDLKIPRKVLYFRESRMSPWKNIVGRSLNQKPVVRPFFLFYDVTADGIWVSWNTRLSMKRWDDRSEMRITERLSLRMVLIFIHFEKSRRLNVLWTIWNCMTVSAEKVPVSLDFCHHRGALV